MALLPFPTPSENMAHSKKKQSQMRTENWKRIVLSFLVLLAIHALFGSIIHMKARPAQGGTILPQDEEETLRVWAMSENDKNLDGISMDFLRWAALKEQPQEAIPLLPVADTPCLLYPELTPETLESSKRSAGLRLNWPEITSQLDSFLPVLPLTQLHPMDSMHFLACKGLLARELDLRMIGVRPRLEMGRWSADQNRRAAALQDSSIAPVPDVLVTRYEDCTWVPVPAEDLAQIIAPLVNEKKLKALKSDIWAGPVQLRIAVISGIMHGARVHLRRSCGIPELDRATLAWIQKRHATPGHHHTDQPLPAKGHIVDYMVEYSLSALQSADTPAAPASPAKETP